MALEEIPCYVSFTKRPPSPLQYHFISPTKRSKRDVSDAERNALVVRPDEIVDELKALKQQVQMLVKWKAMVRARQLISEFHRHKGKNQLFAMLTTLKQKYKHLMKNMEQDKGKEQGKGMKGIQGISSIFCPKDFMGEVRRLVEVQRWLDDPNNVPPPLLCHGRYDIMRSVTCKMMMALEQTLAEHGVPSDYKDAVTIYYKEVNEEVHADVGGEQEDVRMLGNKFLSSLLE